MIFRAPKPFREALESRLVKALLPTTGSSSDLARLAPEIRDRAVFSARTAFAEHLATIDNVVRQILDPSVITDLETGQQRGAQPGEGVNQARARELLRESLKAIGYSPDQAGATPGSLQDLGSERRLNLIIDMNVKMARGYGWWAQGQRPAVLDQWPAQELIRVEDRTVPRNWHARWRNAGGRVFGGTGVDGKEGRLIALKTDPVWENLSRFSNPYPPFDFGSGIGVRDVDRKTAVALGLITADEQIDSQTFGFNEELQASIPASVKQSSLFDAIVRSMGSDVEIVGDVLKFRRAA